MHRWPAAGFLDIDDKHLDCVRNRLLVSDRCKVSVGGTTRQGHMTAHIAIFRQRRKNIQSLMVESAIHQRSANISPESSILPSGCLQDLIDVDLESGFHRVMIDLWWAI